MPRNSAKRRAPSGGGGFAMAPPPRGNDGWRGLNSPLPEGGGRGLLAAVATSGDRGGMAEATNWPDDIFRVFRATDIKQVAYVPDAGHTRLINLCRDDNVIRAIGLTTEEEGVALLAGAWLGGQRGALLMQSSGVGNCINMLSLITQCRFPLLTLVTMRGQWGEFNPWQVPMGQNSGEQLRLAGTLVYPVDEASRMAETVEQAARLAFEGGISVAVLISQRIIGSKTFGKSEQ
jgi:sulfopyruvate decarboxylase alpha subunit